MCEDRLEAILATYPPVEGKPGYVWFSRANHQIVRIDVLREAYKEHFEVGEIKSEGELDDI
jgi:hypothetical protein